MWRRLIGWNQEDDDTFCVEFFSRVYEGGEVVWRKVVLGEKEDNRLVMECVSLMVMCDLLLHESFDLWLLVIYGMMVLVLLL